MTLNLTLFSMQTPIIKIPLLALCLLLASALKAQTLNMYVEEGLKNNLVVQQRNIDLEKAMLSLKIANGMFMPSVGFVGSYTTGDGGRSISLPIGDLLNGVYSTLNQLTDSESFPQVENVEQNFFPRNFYDVKARVAVPIVNTDLMFNKKLNQQQIQLQEYEVRLYKRELVRSIKVAYFNYLSALEGKQIYASALNRALEGKRVNESLLKNGKGLPAYVLRSESEIEQINSQKLDAEKKELNAQMYFNFLLNREANATIVADTTLADNLSGVESVLAETSATSQREELLQLQTGIELNSTALKMRKSFWAPKLSGFVDVGAQGEDMKYSSKSNYYLAGLQLDIPLFGGFTNRHKISQAQLDVKRAELNHTYIGKQLVLSQDVSRNALLVAYQNYQSSLKQVAAAESYQRLIERGYKEGVNTFIESVDARNMLTSAQLLATINQYSVLTAHANLEREMALYRID